MRWGPVTRIVTTIAVLAGILMTAAFLSGFFASGTGNGHDDQPSITVAAASDLIPAFEKIGDLYNEGTDYTVEFTFGSSGLLAQQVEAGAPIDVYVSANVEYVNQLDEQGLLLEDSVQRYAIGYVVIWSLDEELGSRGDVTTLDGPGIRRIAIANPDHAPYGVAGRQVLQSAGIWDDVQDRLVLGANIRETLQYAETGNVDVAIVALSLALATDEGYWSLIPADMHEPINQTLGIVAATEHRDAAQTFVDYVMSDEGRAILEAHGFEIPDKDYE